MIYLGNVCVCIGAWPKASLKQVYNRMHSVYSCCTATMSSTPHQCTPVINTSRTLCYIQKKNVTYSEGSPRHAPPWRVLFFGTDEFALPHLKALNENRLSKRYRLIDTLEVVIPKKSQGVVYQYAEASNLKYHRWPIPTWRDRFDVGILTSFGHLIPRRIINAFPFGILNVHPSLLPRWRGASPIIHTILNGDQETGISIIEIRPLHFDTGPILLQEGFPVPSRFSANQLRDMLSFEGTRLLLVALSNLLTLIRMEHEQPHDGVSYAHLVKLENAYVNWEIQTAEEIDRQYRALGSMFNLRTIWKGNPTRLFDMLSPQEMEAILPGIQKKYPDNSMCPRPGLPYFHKPSKALCIRCKDSWVGFHRLSYKKPMSAQAFYNGYLSKSRNLGVVFISKDNELDKYSFRTAAALPKLVATAVGFA